MHRAAGPQTIRRDPAPLPERAHRIGLRIPRSDSTTSRAGSASPRSDPRTPCSRSRTRCSGSRTHAPAPRLRALTPASTDPGVQAFWSRYECLRWTLQERHKSRSMRRLVASRVRTRGVPASTCVAPATAIVFTGKIPAPTTLLVYPGLPGCSCPPCEKQPSKLGSTSIGGQPGKLDPRRNVRMHFQRAKCSSTGCCATCWTRPSDCALCLGAFSPDGAQANPQGWKNSFLKRPPVTPTPCRRHGVVAHLSQAAGQPGRLLSPCRSNSDSNNGIRTGSMTAADAGRDPASDPGALVEFERIEGFSRQCPPARIRVPEAFATPAAAL